MSCPSRQQLRQRNYSERWVTPATGKVFRAQIQGTQFAHIFGSQAGKFIQ